MLCILVTNFQVFFGGPRAAVSTSSCSWMRSSSRMSNLTPDPTPQIWPIIPIPDHPNPFCGAVNTPDRCGDQNRSGTARWESGMPCFRSSWFRRPETQPTTFPTPLFPRSPRTGSPDTLPAPAACFALRPQGRWPLNCGRRRRRPPYHLLASLFMVRPPFRYR